MFFYPAINLGKYSSMSCDICAEKFNRSFRKPVLCNCEFKCCRKCAKTYLLSKNELPHCMNCKIEWNREFMSGNFEKVFINKEYKEHRETLLLEKEIRMLQATQPEVEKIIKMEEIHLKIESIKEEYYKKIEDLEKELNHTKNSTEKERKKFIRRCPNGECKGFMSTSLKCGVCECFACGVCRELKGFTTAEREAHVCDPEIVKNVEAIQKDSKECPKCSSLTYLMHGCNQIFCTECHAVWDWKTRKIQIGGVIHNPEYFEYQKKLNNGQIPRNPNDIICGRELDHHLARNLRDNSIWMEDACRAVLHLVHADKPRFQYIDDFDDNLYLRISYMRNRLDKEDFKQIIQKKDKKNNKNREITNVFDMFSACMLDIFYNYLENKNEKEARKQIDVLRNHANESFNRISSSYNCKAYQIDKNLYFF